MDDMTGHLNTPRGTTFIPTGGRDSFGSTVTHVSPPRAMPAITLRTPEGAPQALADLYRYRANPHPQALTALVLLRHAGCPFCKVQARELRNHRATLEAAGIQVVLILPEEPERVAQFREAQEVTDILLSDEQRQVHAALDVKPGKVKQIMSPRIFIDHFKAAFRGHTPSTTKPSVPLQLPGAALVDRDGYLHWLNTPQRSVDHAITGDFMAAAEAVRVRMGMPTNVGAAAGG